MAVEKCDWCRLIQPDVRVLPSRLISGIGPVQNNCRTCSAIFLVALRLSSFLRVPVVRAIPQM